VARDTTVVGIPARPVDRKLPRDRRPPHFDPYGMPCDDSLDPVMRDLEGLRAELAEVEARMARIAAVQLQTRPPQPVSAAPSRQTAAE
jgi:serine O-acetyltransferase